MLTELRGAEGKVFGMPKNGGKWDCKAWYFVAFFSHPPPLFSHHPPIFLQFPPFFSHCGSCSYVFHPDVLMIPHVSLFPLISPHFP